jgi:hypothetical protein
MGDGVGLDSLYVQKVSVYAALSNLEVMRTQPQKQTFNAGSELRVTVTVMKAASKGQI